MVTMKQIAAECGCSVATVSKALNAMPDISPHTAQRVREAAEQMGYTPNTAARTLKTNRSHTIGLLLFLRGESVWKHEYFAGMADGLQSVTEAAGYDITPINCETITPGGYLSYCRSRGYDGLIVMSSGLDVARLEELVNSEIPLVTIDYAYHHRGAVLSNNVSGMRELVRYVYSMGHRRIAFIHGEPGVVTQSRVASFYAACEELCIDAPDEYVRESVYRDLDAAARETAALLDLPTPPTCILYPDDYAYVGGRNVIMERGLRIPQDVSTVGYDGIPLAAMMHPRLTTFKQDNEGIGREAGKLILRAIEKPRSFIPEHVTLPGRLMEGETVARLN